MLSHVMQVIVVNFSEGGKCRVRDRKRGIGLLYEVYPDMFERISLAVLNIQILPSEWSLEALELF